MSESRLDFVALRVRDFDASVRFYRDAMGVPLHPDPAGTHQEYTWREGAHLHFAIFPAEEGEEPTSVLLGLSVDDLDAAHAQAIAAGAPVIHEPRQEPWGRTSSYVDPDGNTVQLTDLRRSP